MKKMSCPYCGEAELTEINRCMDGTLLFECQTCKEMLTDEEVTVEVHRGPKKFKKKQEDVE